MKDLGIILLSLLIVAGSIYVVWLSNANTHLKSDNALKQATIDSIKAVKLQPPDTTIIDTTIISIRPIQFSSDFDSLPELGEYNTYNDSIVNDSIRVWAEIKANELYRVNWTYEPVILEREVTISKPYPVVVPEYIHKPQSGFFLTGGVGFGREFTGSAGAVYLNNSGFFYGGEVIQAGDVTGFGFRVGVKIW